jgi:hypothetical protein
MDGRRVRGARERGRDLVSGTPSNVRTSRLLTALTQVGDHRLPADPVDEPPLTPLYDSLTTNLAHPIMAYPSFAFPPSTPLFPDAATVQRYLEAYAEHFNLRRHIQFNTTVTLVERTDHDQWAVSYKHGGHSRTELYDHVAVTNGHYRVPRVPDTPGLAEWLATGRAMHAVYFRHPLPEHREATVLVVGAGPSGTDISRDLRAAARVVVHSVTGGEAEAPEAPDYKRRGRVIAYRADGSVVFEDGSTFAGVDRCVLATGYDFSFPFLPWLPRALPPVNAPPTSALVNSGYHVFPLARHLFPLAPGLPPGSIAFVGLPWKVAPFPLFEAQARALVHVLTDPGAFDAAHEADAVRRRAQQHSQGASARELAKAWHRFEEQEQFDYRDELNAWAAPSAPAGRPCGSWVRELYPRNFDMRAQWRELERCGEAEAWVRGVGRGGLEEWIDLMWRVYRRGEQKDQVNPAADGGRI